MRLLNCSSERRATRQPLQTLEEIETTVRGQIRTHVGPELGNFLSARLAAPSQAVSDI